MTRNALWLMGGLLGCLVLTGTTRGADTNPSKTEKTALPLPELARQELDAIEAELLHTRSELRKRKVELVVMKERAKRDADAGRASLSEQTLEDLLARDPDYATLLTRLREVDAEFARLKSVTNAAAGDKRLKGLEEHRRSLASSLDERRKNLATRLEKGVTITTSERVRDAEDRIAYLTKLEEALTSDAVKLRVAINKETGSEDARVERLEGELRKLKATIQELMNQKKRYCFGVDRTGGT